MKQVAIKSTVDMLQKIETIEKEVMDLKVSVLKKLSTVLLIATCFIAFISPLTILWRNLP